MKNTPEQTELIKLWDAEDDDTGTGANPGDNPHPYVIDRDPDMKIKVGNFTVRMHYMGTGVISMSQVMAMLRESL
jgi:hypothetical protein